MKVADMTKKEIISKILYYDSSYSKYLCSLQCLRKSALINVYAIVLLDYVSSTIIDVSNCKFNEYIKDFLR